MPLRCPPRVRARPAGLDHRRPRLVQAQAALARRPHPLVLEPVAFLRRLVGIIAPPRRHLVRYAGVFGPASKARAKLRAVVPATDPDGAATPRCPTAKQLVGSRARRLLWADLLRRGFAQDVLACPCGGRRTVVAFVTDPCPAHSLLTALGLPAAPATFAPARDPPQAELDWEDPASPHQPTTTARPSP